MKHRRASDQCSRGVLRSPGRPTVVQRDTLRSFWRAIAGGQMSQDAARTAGVSTAVGVRWFRASGGRPPSHLAPAALQPSGRYLALSEREELAILRAQGLGVRAIARTLARDPSTVSRELRRNAATRSGGFVYRASTAQWHAERVARRPKVARLVKHTKLRDYVQDRLAGVIAAPTGARVSGPVVTWKGRRHGRRQHRRWALAWSPEQIAHRLLLDFPHDPSMRISHEAIYQARYVQGRGALRRELTACLPRGACCACRGREHADAERASSPPRFSLASAHRRWLIGRYQVIGRGISSWVSTALPLARSSNAPRASRCCCICHRWPNTNAACVKRMVLRSLATGPRRCAMPLHVQSPPCPSNSDALLRGIKEQRCRNTYVSESTPACRCISTIHKVRGSAVRTRTPTACSASTFHEGPT